MVSALALLTGACVSMPIAPVPRDLMVPGAPADVVRESARALALAEFELTTSDAAAGILQAKRTRGPRSVNWSALKCFFDSNSGAYGHLRSTIAITLSAVPRGDSSAVRIATVVTSSYPGMGLLAGEHEDHCVSNGTIEASVVQALAATRR